MISSAVRNDLLAPSAAAAPVVAAITILESRIDMPLVAIPRPEVHLVVRIGQPARGGLDAHALGSRQQAHRKLIRGGQRAATVRLRLGAPEAVLGVPATALLGRTVALDELWGDATMRRLFDQISGARDTAEAAAILDRAIAERIARGRGGGARARLAVDAAERLASASVNEVAASLGVSERHLRRVFRETVGLGPKAFARLTRFHRALRAAREDPRSSWASVAAAAGYYDQAHLIAEFRALSGATPRRLIDELSVAPLLA